VTYKVRIIAFVSRPGAPPPRHDALAAAHPARLLQPSARRRAGHSVRCRLSAFSGDALCRPTQPHTAPHRPSRPQGDPLRATRGARSGPRAAGVTSGPWAGWPWFDGGLGVQGPMPFAAPHSPNGAHCPSPAIMAPSPPASRDTWGSLRPGWWVLPVGCWCDLGAVGGLVLARCRIGRSLAHDVRPKTVQAYRRSDLLGAADGGVLAITAAHRLNAGWTAAQHAGRVVNRHASQVFTEFLLSCGDTLHAKTENPT